MPHYRRTLVTQAAVIQGLLSWHTVVAGQSQTLPLRLRTLSRPAKWLAHGLLSCPPTPTLPGGQLCVLCVIYCICENVPGFEKGLIPSKYNISNGSTRDHSLLIFLLQNRRRDHMLCIRGVQSHPPMARVAAGFHCSETRVHMIGPLKTKTN